MADIKCSGGKHFTRISRELLPMLEDPFLPNGWKRNVVQRKRGASVGKYDVYIYSPNGKKFRSRKELLAYISQESLEFDVNSFDFTVWGKQTVSKMRPHAPSDSILTHNLPTDLVKQEDKIISTCSGNFNSQKSCTAQSAVNKSNVVSFVAPKTEEIQLVIPKNSPDLTSLFIFPEEEEKEEYMHGQYEKIMPPKPAKHWKWTPPRSPYNLIQETLYHDPWQLLVATIFLHRTSAKVAVPLIWTFFAMWPSPEAILNSDVQDIALLMQPLGLHGKRALIIKKFSSEFMGKKWTYPKELYGIGKYGDDSYRIFCLNEWKIVQPTDSMLRLYISWLWNNYKTLGLD